MSPNQYGLWLLEQLPLLAVAPIGEQLPTTDDALGQVCAVPDIPFLAGPHRQRIALEVFDPAAVEHLDAWAQAGQGVTLGLTRSNHTAILAAVMVERTSQGPRFSERSEDFDLIVHGGVYINPYDGSKLWPVMRRHRQEDEKRAAEQRLYAYGAELVPAPARQRRAHRRQR